MRIFKDIEVGDEVVVYDEYSHDYIEHIIKVNSIEYYNEFITKDNPKGMICYGTDLKEKEWGDNYITVVTESNFVRMTEDTDRLIMF